MTTIQTLGHPSTKKEFTYTGNVKEGVKLLVDSDEVEISPDFFKAILNCFKGVTITGGFSMANPTPGGFGIWVKHYSQEMNPAKLSPQHALIVASILEHEGYINCSLKGSAVKLQFHNNYEL